MDSGQIFVDNRMGTIKIDDMKSHSNINQAPAPVPSVEHLLRLIDRLVDGVDGYECENGNLRYWNADAVEEARNVLRALPIPE